MTTRYSIYEAKAKFSEVMRKVRAGQTIVVTYRREEVAEIRPLSSVALSSRLIRLEGAGIVSRPSGRAVALRPLARRPGAARFLKARA